MTRSWLLILLILLVHLVLLINTRFTLWPEMVVYPYLLNNGFALYRDIINPYPPLLTYSLAIFVRIFGYQSLPYQILTWGIILITDIVIFIISKKIFKKNSLAFVSTLSFAILSISFSISGLWFDLIQTPFVLGSFYYFYRFFNDPKSGRLLVSSILFLTIAFFIKQQIAWLAIWYLIILFVKFTYNTKEILTRNYLIFVPVLILFVLQILFFWQRDLLKDFTFWVIYFPFFKASTMPGYLLWPTIRQALIVLALFLLFTPILFKEKFKSILIVLTGFILVLFAYPRFDYFHLIPSLAILSLAFGQNLKSFLKSKIVIQSVFTLSLIFLILFTVRYFKNNSTQEVRFFEKDIIEAASSLNKITNPDDSIYIQNGPDQLLALSNRLPSKPWADEFPWYLEIPGLQEKVVEGIEKRDPKFIIFKPYDKGPKYELGAYRPEEIAGYLDQNYQNLTQISDTLWLKVGK